MTLGLRGRHLNYLATVPSKKYLNIQISKHCYKFSFKSLLQLCISNVHIFYEQIWLGSVTSLYDLVIKNINMSLGHWCSNFATKSKIITLSILYESTYKTAGTCIYTQHNWKLPIFTKSRTISLSLQKQLTSNTLGAQL